MIQPTNTAATLNARFCVAVVALDEDGNEVATLWPLDDAGKQWATSSKHAFTDDDCKVMSRHAVGVLERLRAHWVELAREAL